MATTRILVVEAEAGVTTDLERRLRKMGHDVNATSAPFDGALNAAQRTQPDLVFLETLLSGPLGALATAQGLRQVRDVPVIYLTCDADAAALQDAMGTEPFAYVLQPFNDRELHAAMQFALYRHRNDAKLRKVERWLSATLSSIGDAVIATDPQGQVTLINAVAQRLTGWTDADAVGRPFNEVFAVVDTVGRAPILDLIDRALVHGFSIGVDDNVMLQPRGGGVEVPIDDSIAPIRDDAGRTTGVVVVFRDGTARQLAERSAQAANEQLEHRVQERTAQLEAANRALEAFSASVSHDLRAPLRAVSGYSTLMTQRYAGVLDVEGKKFLKIIQNKSEQMARMIDDFMRLSNLREAPLRFVLLDIDAMLPGVLAGLAEDNPVALGIVLGSLPGFEGDEGLIRQVWVNLLNNALKFTAKREHPQISITGDESDGRVNFHVTDNGAGFDMAYADRLFMPFQRLHSEHDFEGNGIGLATVKRVVDRHGGQLHAEGRVNEGACFHFSVPKRHERAVLPH
jgi:PAS domain S-box-containing protein